MNQMATCWSSCCLPRSFSVFSKFFAKRLLFCWIAQLILNFWIKIFKPKLLVIDSKGTSKLEHKQLLLMESAFYWKPFGWLWWTSLMDCHSRRTLGDSLETHQMRLMARAIRARARLIGCPTIGRTQIRNVNTLMFAVYKVSNLLASPGKMIIFGVRWSCKQFANVNASTDQVRRSSSDEVRLMKFVWWSSSDEVRRNADEHCWMCLIDYRALLRRIKTRRT